MDPGVVSGSVPGTVDPCGAFPGAGTVAPGWGVAVPGVGAALPGAGATVPGAGFTVPGVVWPGMDCPDGDRAPPGADDGADPDWPRARRLQEIKNADIAASKNPFRTKL